ncbi:ion channel [Bradyrhizobium sp. CCBAU 65884]|uniref:ion channel n=1 Tax=Bradyrhizobium sp. CCBAU 65884 TaxID=722477 RepID=UPI003FA455F3
MWSYFYVFLARTAADFPFCSGTDPIDPKQFGLLESIYFTVTSFATVGYGDIYACTSGSRWALVAELSNGRNDRFHRASCPGEPGDRSRAAAI